jgi:tetratricopeptide (TPR) repeat protein
MIHPVYKAFALLFPAGDVNKGLAELQKAASEGTVLDAEAGFMLSWIYAGYEYDYEKSLKYSRLLYEKYPGNSSYLANYIKFLLLVKQYDEAEKLIFSAGSKINNTFFRAQITVFNGILKEKKYRDISAALECYREGLNYLVPFGDFGNEYSAYACYGLSRVYAADKTGDLKRRFRKEANRLAEFRHMNFER